MAQPGGSRPTLKADSAVPDAGGTAVEGLGAANGTAVNQRFLQRHTVALSVLLVGLVATVAASLALYSQSNDQEKRLLTERANELAAVLASTTSDTQSVLFGAGTAAVNGGPSSPLFLTLASPIAASGASLVVAEERNGMFVTTAVAGKAVPVGFALADGRGDLAIRALTTQKVVTAVIPGQPSHILIALHIPAAMPTVAMVDQVEASGPQVADTPDSPYRNLKVAVYASANPNPSTLVLAYGGLPGNSEKRAQHSFVIGADTWIVVISAKQSLEGPFAGVLPWVVLGGGAVLAGLLAMIVEVLARRRAYALALVDERTKELRQAQATAENANRAKSEFLSRMSHELRTPLNAVLGFSQILEFDPLSEEQAKSVGHIQRGGRHLLDLINEILDITQIETGQMSFSPESVLVSDVVTDATELVRPLAEERSVHLLSADRSACNHYIFADRQRLKQILLNLLGNGIKYNRQGGSVSISCFQPTRGRLRIQVTDTGPGIAREDYALLFTPFERLGAEQTTVEGTGIGLALSRRLAEAMGGTIDVESTVGRGSTFWVEFPLVEGPVERYERTDGQANGGTRDMDASGSPTVLHIEDNLSNVDLVEKVLEQRPEVRLIPAMQGRLGLELARQHRPMLILLDLNLADVPGDEVLQRLREDPATAGIPVAIVSADAMPRQVQRLLSSGASAYLTKPIEVPKLLMLVDEALAARAAARVTSLPTPSVRTDDSRDGDESPGDG